MLIIPTRRAVYMTLFSVMRLQRHFEVTIGWRILRRSFQNSDVGLDLNQQLRSRFGGGLLDELLDELGDGDEDAGAAQESLNDEALAVVAAVEALVLQQPSQAAL